MKKKEVKHMRRNENGQYSDLDAMSHRKRVSDAVMRAKKGDQAGIGELCKLAEPLCRSMIAKWHMEPDDIRQIVYLSVCTCVQTIDESKGVEDFFSYVKKSVIRMLYDEHYSMAGVYIPSNARNIITKLDKDDFAKQHDEVVDDIRNMHECSDELAESIATISNLAKSLSGEYKINVGEPELYDAMLAKHGNIDHGDTVSVIESVTVEQVFRIASENMDMRKVTIAKRRFVGGETMTAIASDYNLSVNRISQICNEFLADIRKLLGVRFG